LPLNVLIINNYHNKNDRVNRLYQIVRTSGIVRNITLRHFWNMPKNTNKFDAIIMTGSPLNLTDIKRKDSETYVMSSGGLDFIPLFKLIQTSNVPLLGICFGHQLIAYSYDKNCVVRYRGKVPDCDKEYKRIRKFKFKMKNDPLLSYKEEITVDLVHNNYVIPTPKLTKNLKTLLIVKGESNRRWIQYLRTRDGLKFGVQFHPETQYYPTYIKYYKKDRGCTYKQTVSDGFYFIDKFLKYSKSVKDMRLLSNLQL